MTIRRRSNVRSMIRRSWRRRLAWRGAGSTSQGSAPRDGRAQKSPARESTEHEQNHPDDHGDHRVAPRIASEKRRRHTQHAKADGRFAATAAFGARTPPALASHDDVVWGPRVEHEPEANQSKDAADNEWDEFETQHPWAESGAAIT